MKQYLDLKNTPLKFHRIYAAVVLPLDMFLNIYSLITIIASIAKNGAGTWDWITLGTTIVYLVLIMASFRGLLVFKKRGLYAAWTLLGLQIVDNAYTFYLSYMAGDTVFMVSSVLSILILSSIIVYYVLRRKLFTKEGIDVAAFMAKKSAEAQRQQESFVPAESVMDVGEEEKEEDVGEYDCPRCGYHITDGKVFCPKCGAQTRSVRR